MRDQYDREITYMRLAVTDRCNLRRKKIQNINRDDLALFDHSF
mgnify:CR=1 FL=1